MKIDEVEKKYRALTKFRKKCKCGHSVYVLGDYKLCTYCGNYIFKDDRTEFKYRLNLTRLK